MLASCGTSDDQRPRNLDYITEAILAPSCGAAVCHSSFRQESGFVFDTVDNARRTFQGDPQLIGFDDADPDKTPGLILNLTAEQPGAPRMPYDKPLPDADIALIEIWLKEGAPGVCNGLRACLGAFAVRCITTHSTTQGEQPLGAYDLADITATNNCAAKGMTCAAGECR